MADGKIKISELSEALQINNDAVFPYSQDNGGTDATFKGTVVQIARKVNEGVDFTNLETSNKKIVGAINQTLNNFAEEYDPNETYNTGDPTLHSGTLYKCKADNTTGTWDSTKWEEAKAVDFGSGGGGSGGHTILDDSGTSLTQRTNLQFKGAYSEDNSTDNTTEVNVVREMTKAEFDELTEEEKKGFINVTDVTSGEEDKFQPVIYSEDEREIGVWTDGKPLYERVVDLGSDTNISYDTWTLTTVSISEVDRLVLIQGLNSAGTAYYGDLYGGNNNGYLQLLTGRNGTYVSVRYLIFRYTKTTDQAGSGQWTPQGVPAHHYSEDEQVIGTWVDGSTLYEKTVYISSLPNNATIEYSTGLSNITPIGFDNALIFASGNISKAPYTNSGGTTRIAIQFNADGKIYLGTTTDQSSTSAYVTLRYTKTST